MPGLLNFLYEQLSYPKILPFVCNLSMKISPQQAILVKRVLGGFMPNISMIGRTFPSEAGKCAMLVR